MTGRSQIYYLWGEWGSKEGEKKRSRPKPGSWESMYFLFFQFSFTEKEMTAYRDESPSCKISSQSQQQADRKVNDFYFYEVFL